MHEITTRENNGLFKAFVTDDSGAVVFASQRVRRTEQAALTDLAGELDGLAQDARRKATEARNEPVVV